MNFKYYRVRDVLVSFSTGTAACSAAGVVISITFTQAFGNLPLLIGDSSSLAVTGGTATLTIAKVTAGTKENVECSNRGICDRATGRCKCFKGYSSSDGAGSFGNRGDCGYHMTDVCPT